MAARNLRALTPVIPRFLPLPVRAAIRVGALLAPIAPWLVVPAARLALRRMVRHLVVDASETRLGAAISRIRGGNPNVRLNINLLGEAILGENEAARRLDGTRRAAAARGRQLRLDQGLGDGRRRTLPGPSMRPSSTPRRAGAAVPDRRHRSSEAQKFINLDMEEYRDLDLTLAVFTALLDRDEFLDLEAGIVLQAYLPDALGAMMRAAAVVAGPASTRWRAGKGAGGQGREPADGTRRSGTPRLAAGNLADEAGH